MIKSSATSGRVFVSDGRAQTRKLIALAAAMFCCAFLVRAQFAPLPQADSPEEFDAYLRVVEAATPSAVIAAGDAFRRAWPTSALRAHVYELEFEAYRALGDEKKAIDAGEESLRAAPDNLVVLANLAVVLANATSDSKRLARAKEYGLKVIALSKSFRAPRFISPEEWERTSARLNSQAHSALGLVANAEGRLADAIREFETAIALAPSPDATQCYRLGVLYRTAGNTSGAIQKFRQAAGLNEPAIRRLAERQLRELERR